MNVLLRGMLVVLGTVGMLVMPVVARAQTASAIAGQVKDTSGAVLPGVTVEASSPALIEKVRSVVTDGQGQYRIVDLRPGVYVVTFSLTGFSSVKRENIDLPASFTATINIELGLGNLSETVTVTGESPIVDVSNATPRSRITAETLDTLPTGKTLEAFISLTPGLINTQGAAPGSAQDVGGSKGETYVTPAIHGGHGLESRTILDGFETNNPDNGGGGRVFIPNPMSTQEVSLGLGSGAAESQTSGVQINFIPRDGGNAFRGSMFGNFTNEKLQSAANLSSELIARGVTQAGLPQIGNVWDVNGGIGGPLMRDRLWFFTAHRSWGSQNSVVGQFYNKEPHDSWFYTKDTSKPAINDFIQQSDNVRLTWQASPRNKVNFSYDWEYRCDCHRDVSATNSPEAARVRLYWPQVTAITWSLPASNRLLLEAGTQLSYLPLDSEPHDFQDAFDIPVNDTLLNLSYRASTGGYGRSMSKVNNTRASASYVTGSHAFKAGFEMRNPRKDYEEFGSAISYTFRGGVPTGVTLYARPLRIKATGVALAGYLQDQWTMNRLTLNLGVRLDTLNSWVPEVSLPAGVYVPARKYPKVDCVPCWTDVTPRASASYDLFGNGRTAIKFAFGKYLGAELLNLADAVNPQNSSNPTTNRSWNDANRDFVPQESELGPYSNQSFGQTVITRRYADDVLKGNRPYNYQTSFLIQHEVMPGMAASFGYFRTSWHNFRATDNQDVTPADYDQFCVTLPADSRLPAGGGNKVCGLYDIKPAKFGVNNNLLVTQASRFGKQSEVYNGLDLTVAARLPRATVQGGLSTGRTETDRCFVVDNPQSMLFCHVKPPFWQPQIKLSGSYRLPASVQASAVFQSLPGVPIAASYVATNAEVIPTLGRPLAGGAANITIPEGGAALGTAPAPGFSFPSPGIIPPQTMFEDRSTQLDIRIDRGFSFGRSKLRAMFDIYNVLNNTPILGINTRYGPAWKNPTFVLDARVFKFGAQLDF